MINVRKIAATSALGLSVGFALLGTGVANASGPAAVVRVRNASNVRVTVIQNSFNEDHGNDNCGWLFNGWGQPWGGWGWGGW